MPPLRWDTAPAFWPCAVVTHHRCLFLHSLTTTVDAQALAICQPRYSGSCQFRQTHPTPTPASVSEGNEATRRKKGFTRSASWLFSTVPCSRCSSWAWLQCDILSAPGRKCEEQPPRTSPPRVVLPWFGSPLTFCLLEGGIMSKESDCRQLTSRSHKFL